MAGMWSNQSIIPTFDVSAKTAEPKMAFNFAHLLSAACGGAARRLRALRARFFSLFLSFSQCNFTKKMPFFAGPYVMLKFCKNLAGPCGAPTYLPTYLPTLLMGN